MFALVTKVDALEAKLQPMPQYRVSDGIGKKATFGPTFGPQAQSVADAGRPGW